LVFALETQSAEAQVHQVLADSRETATRTTTISPDTLLKTERIGHMLVYDESAMFFASMTHNSNTPYRGDTHAS